ncbi:MAG: hypothetical protein IT290_01365 [Deltaproteobacteria bacterium]|nr:hypothetical protein [Deltaproteobacteria bacterium]
MAAYGIDDWKRHWVEGDTPWSSSGDDSALPPFYQRLRTHIPSSHSARALVPLCGASTAVRYLYDQGHSVVGIDVIPQAIETLIARSFPELALTERHDGSFRILSGPRLELWIGDFFQMPDSAEKSDFIYDCASYVALSRSQLERYVPIIKRELRVGGIYAIVANEFSAEDWKGPPYPFDRSEALSRFVEFEIIDETSAHIVRTEPKFVERGVSESTQHRIALRKSRE